MEIEDITRIAVLETRFDTFEKNITSSLDEHKEDFRQFEKSNSEEHKETKAALTKLQNIVAGGIAIICFISFMSAAKPFIMDMFMEPSEEIRS